VSELAVSWCRNDTAFSCLALLMSLPCLAILSTIQRYYKGMTIPNCLAVSPTSKLGVSVSVSCRITHQILVGGGCRNDTENIGRFFPPMGCNFPPIKGATINAGRFWGVLRALKWLGDM